MIISINKKKTNLTCFHNKSPTEYKTKGNVPQHNKSNRLETQIQKKLYF